MKTFRRVSLYIFVSTFLVLVSQAAFGWGFWAHKVINKEAVGILPEPLKDFYQKNIDYVAAHAPIRILEGMKSKMKGTSIILTLIATALIRTSIFPIPTQKR